MPQMEYLDSPIELKASDIDDEGRFNGIASTFGGEADSHGDIIKRGAFKKTILEGGRNKTGIEMLKNHRSSEILGVWLGLSEAKAGLKVDGQLALGTQLADETRTVMKLKAKVGQSFGLSIGFNAVVAEDRRNDEGRFIGRLIKEISLWEVSVVTFPSNINARTGSIKSVDDIKTERDLENFLRELGVSNKEALYITKLCKPGLRELVQKDQSSELKGLLELVNNLKQTNTDVSQLIQGV
jgi:HK97 family phage prohead protease